MARCPIAYPDSFPRTWMSALVLTFLLAATARPASAQLLDPNFWITDGDVEAAVPWGNTLYIGGTFAYVGPNTGGWNEIDGAGRAVAHLPRVTGEVGQTISDGAGGWWICGLFTKVAGIDRPGVAHVLADGSVSPWTPTPAPAGNVVCMAREGTRVFVATSSNLHAYDATTGSQIL